jgi:hypothetical protein
VSHLRPFTAVLALTGLAALTACSPSPAAGISGSPSPQGTATSVAVAGAPGATQPPTTRAPIPDGAYRVRITQEQLVDAGLFDGQAVGTWTLTLKDGSYQLRCDRVTGGREECGHSSHDSLVVEVGSTAGDGHQLWLLYDQAKTLGVNKCTDCNPPNKQMPPYRLDWRLDKDALRFSNVWAASRSGNVTHSAQYTMTPWQRIG